MLTGNTFIFSPKDDEALKKQELIQEHNMKEDEIRKKVKTCMNLLLND